MPEPKLQLAGERSPGHKAFGYALAVLGLIGGTIGGAIVGAKLGALASGVSIVGIPAAPVVVAATTVAGAGLGALAGWKGGFALADRIWGRPQGVHAERAIAQLALSGVTFTPAERSNLGKLKDGTGELGARTLLHVPSSKLRWAGARRYFGQVQDPTRRQKIRQAVLHHFAVNGDFKDAMDFKTTLIQAANVPDQGALDRAIAGQPANTIAYRRSSDASDLTGPAGGASGGQTDVASQLLQIHLDSSNTKQPTGSGPAAMKGHGRSATALASPHSQGSQPGRTRTRTHSQPATPVHTKKAGDDAEEQLRTALKTIQTGKDTSLDRSSESDDLGGSGSGSTTKKESSFTEPDMAAIASALGTSDHATAKSRPSDSQRTDGTNEADDEKMAVQPETQIGKEDGRERKKKSGASASATDDDSKTVDNNDNNNKSSVTKPVQQSTKIDWENFDWGGLDGDYSDGNG